MQILKVISALMNHPTAELQAARAELAEAISRSVEIPPAMRTSLIELTDEICSGDLMELQETYGDLYEQGRSVSLLMFEHVHGDSRDRGQAMVDLMALYNENGFHINVRELPDYIPLYLEYLAQRDDIDAREGLADVAHIFTLLSVRLHERGSLYSYLFDALTIISGVSVDKEELIEQTKNEERDDTMEALDKVWEEEQVSFMANLNPEEQSSCNPNPKPMKAKESVAEPIHWIPDSPKSSSNVEQK